MHLWAQNQLQNLFSILSSLTFSVLNGLRFTFFHRQKNCWLCFDGFPLIDIQPSIEYANVRARVVGDWCNVIQ